VAELAAAHGLPVLSPRRPRGAAFERELVALGGEVFVVAAYGAILPPGILALPPRGSLNVHASLLPAYRGAAPVTRAILEGRDETGVTIMRMEPGLDTGPICLQVRTPIEASDSAGSLTGRLAELGGRAAVDALDRLEAGTLTETPQDGAQATWADKVTTAEAEIDWARPARAIERAARAYDPWPGAWTTFRGERLKVFRVSELTGPPAGEPGEIRTLGPAPVVRAGDADLALELVHPPGARRMTGAEWARGRGVRAGERLGPAE
jgi:methionyl-tRNA formyltransferase